MPTPFTPSRPAGSLVPRVDDYSDPSQVSRAAGSAATGLVDQGQASVGKGMETLGPVISRLMKLLTGDTSTTEDAIAPAARGVIAQYDTARRAAAQFSPRGGGTASAITESRSKEAGDLGQLRVSAKNDAVSQLTQIAQLLLQSGTAQEEAGTYSLSNILQSAITQRGQNMSLWGDIGSAAGSVLGALILA